jgi:hypothetical protein
MPQQRELDLAANQERIAGKWDTGMLSCMALNSLYEYLSIGWRLPAFKPIKLACISLSPWQRCTARSKDDEIQKIARQSSVPDASSSMMWYTLFP